MKSRRFRILVAIMLALIFIYTSIYLSQIELVFHEEVLDIEGIARQLNIRNMVTTVYLGPRIFDTFLEVMVVILTVFGMKFIRTKQ